MNSNVKIFTKVTIIILFTKVTIIILKVDRQSEWNITRGTVLVFKHCSTRSWPNFNRPWRQNYFNKLKSSNNSESICYVRRFVKYHFGSTQFIIHDI